MKKKKKKKKKRERERERKESSSKKEEDLNKLKKDGGNMNDEKNLGRKNGT